MRFGCALAVFAALAVAAPPAASQDVELLSEIYGTPLPAGYFGLKARDPDAFQFAHGRAARMRERMRTLQDERLVRTDAPMAIGPREGVVQGTFHLPVLLGLFSDSPENQIPFPRDVVQDAYFGAGPETIKAYYMEVSGGRVTLEGDIADWVRSSVTQASATGGESGLVQNTVGPYILDLLAKLPGIDWGKYDNDGPDGIPNSGDDDGYVDALAVIHPTRGAECGGTGKDDRIWSHKWSLRSAAGRTFTTATPSANGGYIRVDDYFIQPAIRCSNSGLNEIGVFTHEAGHAFGLPDLYDTWDGDGKHNGVGNWDLMATGAWGCNGNSPALPCHLGAWSKAVLGWVDVVTLADGIDLGTLTLPPVESSGTVFRVNAADGSGEYYLLENRQRIGFDLALPGTGLLIWQINPTLVAQRWPVNTVNAFSQLAVWLRQADGLEQLGAPGGNRGDAGDPFPYTGSGVPNHVFHAGSTPASRSRTGTATGVTVLDIQRSSQDIVLHASTRFTAVTLETEGHTGSGGLLAVDGLAVDGASHTFVSAPFDRHVVTASPGESLGAGVRRPFIAWADDPAAPRERSVDTPLDDLVLTARYGGRQVELAMEITGGLSGIAPGTVSAEPASADLWFTEGVTVALQAVPRTGFGFLEWSGVLAGQPNPATLTMDAPANAGAAFELTYALPAEKITIAAAEQQNRLLEPRNGNAPFTWSVLSGTLAEGLFFGPEGRLTGVALETGTFGLEVEVRDAIGLTARGDLTVEVEAPELPVAQLGSPFLLTGPTLTVEQRRFLDEQGNRNGIYDLGDFRAWLLAHPGLPLSAAMRALVGVPDDTGRPEGTPSGREGGR